MAGVAEKEGFNFSTPDEMEDVLDVYFADCDKREKPYTMSGIARALGVSRYYLMKYSNRTGYDVVIRKAKQRCEQNIEEQLLVGRNQVGAIFNLKNNYGWQDKSMLEHNASQTLADMIKGANRSTKK